MDNEPNGRRLHHWIGKDRTADIAELADTIAAVGKLFNHDGVIVQLDPKGKLIQLNLAGLRAFIDQHICGVRLVALDNGWQWQRQYFTYQFEPRQRPNPMHWPPPQSIPDETEPDATVLDEIYRHELAPRLPRAQSFSPV